MIWKNRMAVCLEPNFGGTSNDSLLYIIFPDNWSDYKVPKVLDLPGGAVVKNPPANAGDTGSSPGPGRSHMLWSS